MCNDVLFPTLQNRSLKPERGFCFLEKGPKKNISGIQELHIYHISFHKKSCPEPSAYLYFESNYFPKSLVKVFEIFFSALTDCYNFRHNADGPKQLRITSNTVLSLCILCCSHRHSQIKTPKQKKLHSPWRKAINTLSVSVMQPRLDKIKSC